MHNTYRSLYAAGCRLLHFHTVDCDVSPVYGWQPRMGFGFSIGVKVSGKRPYRCVGRSKWVGLETCFMETQKLHHMTLNFDQGFENRKISAAFQEAPHDRL